MIDSLKPPTDNLYKFMCVCGLILFLLSVTYPPWLLNKIVHSYLENRRDFEMLEIDLDSTRHQSEILSNQADALNRERNDSLKQVEDLKGRVADKRHLTRADKATFKEDLDRIVDVRNQIVQKDREWVEKMMAVIATGARERKDLIAIKYKVEATIWDTRSAWAIAILALFTSVGGVLLGVKGFNLWSLRVQVYQDAILRKQAALETEEEGPRTD